MIELHINMTMWKYVLFCVTALALTGVQSKSEKKLICYYGTWATYRSGQGKFDVSDIRTDLCTHLVYTFVGLADDGNILILDPYLDLPDNWGRDNFGKFNALKQQNPDLKTILAVGGWNEASAKYSRMANNPALRKVFVSSATNTLLKYNFDGLDMDWEYPNRRDTVHGASDIENFTLLLKELRAAFDQHGLILSAAVASVKEMASLSYDIPAISKILDFISIMTYDMHGAWDDVTGHNAPLHKGLGDDNVSKEDAYTVDVAVQYWLDQGCPPEKLILGLPLYGRTFTLATQNSSVRAPVSGAGIAGPYTAQSGIIGYNEFCVKLQSEDWDIRYDYLAKVPYAVKSNNWVSFDTATSLTLKTQFALEKNLGGMMVWSIETDDFHGLCHEGNFPLLSSINMALGRKIQEVSSTTTISTAKPTTTEVWSTKPPHTPNPSNICQKEGYAKDPEDCAVFYICTRSENGELIPHKFTCPTSLLWDNVDRICNYPDLVDCDA